MENNEDTNTNMMDLLPNEMVIKIFEHFENLTDLLTLPKVNHRFNELSKLKCYRNHLLIEDNEIAAFSLEEFNMKMQVEIKKCRDLKAVTYIASRRFGCARTIFDHYSLVIKTLSRIFKHEIDEDDIGSFSVSNSVFTLISYLKKSAGDMSRVVQMVPSAKGIRAKGTSKTFLSAIENSKDTLCHVNYEGTDLTLAHLHALGECKKLSVVQLTSNLKVSEEVPESFHNIQAKIMTLEGNFHCPYVANFFSSNTLLYLTVYYSTIAGFEKELFTKCTKLGTLKINMESEREDRQNDQVAASIIELVETLKHHKTLVRIFIYNVNQSIPNSLYEPLSVCLESFPSSRVMLVGPAILIRLKW